MATSSCLTLSTVPTKASSQTSGCWTCPCWGRCGVVRAWGEGGGFVGRGLSRFLAFLLGFGCLLVALVFCLVALVVSLLLCFLAFVCLLAGAKTLLLLRPPFPFGKENFPFRKTSLGMFWKVLRGHQLVFVGKFYSDFGLLLYFWC